MDVTNFERLQNKWLFSESDFQDPENDGRGRITLIIDSDREWRTESNDSYMDIGEFIWLAYEHQDDPNSALLIAYSKEYNGGPDPAEEVDPDAGPEETDPVEEVDYTPEHLYSMDLVKLVPFDTNGERRWHEFVQKDVLGFDSDLPFRFVSINNGTLMYKEGVQEGTLQTDAPVVENDDITMQLKRSCSYSEYLDNVSFTCQPCPANRGTLEGNENYCVNCGVMWQHCEPHPESINCKASYQICTDPEIELGLYNAD